MGRRDQWKQVRDSMGLQSGHMGKTVEEREKMPEKGCGLCKNFLENAYSHDGRGSCKVLKMGSKIDVEPPVIVSEGEAGLITFFNTDGARCPHFLKQELIDRELSEVADPEYRRAHRQMKDR